MVGGEDFGGCSGGGGGVDEGWRARGEVLVQGAVTWRDMISKLEEAESSMMRREGGLG